LEEFISGAVQFPRSLTPIAFTGNKLPRDLIPKGRTQPLEEINFQGFRVPRVHWNKATLIGN